MLNQLLQLLLFVGLPVICVGIVSLFMWANLPKPWLFVVASVVVLYLLYFVAFYFAAPANVVTADIFVPINQLRPGTQGSTNAGPSAYSLVRIYLRPIVLFLVAALPTLWLVAKVFHRQ